MEHKQQPHQLPDWAPIEAARFNRQKALRRHEAARERHTLGSLHPDALRELGPISRATLKYGMAVVRLFYNDYKINRP